MAWICDKNGNHRCEIKQLSYNGTFMGVSSITVTVESPAPIAFAIGDYIDWDYDGLRYTLDTAAGVEKQARRNSVGNAFLYENLVFLSPLQAAQNADFFDVILGNTNDFLTNTEFSFYGTAWDYAKRLEANLCRLYGSGTWKVRIWTNGTCYDATPATGIGTGAWENKLVDVSGIKCLGGFQQIYDLWGCAYVFSVVSGVNYVDFYDDFEQYAKAWQAGGMDKIFAYGKGNGLYKIRHTPDADHVLVTRLRPYGSGDNIPANYYLNSEEYHVDGNESSELAISHLMLPASKWTKDGVKHPSNAYLEQNTDIYGVREGVVLWDGSDPELGEIKPSIYRLSIQDLLDLMAAGDSYRPDEAKWPDTTQRIDKIITGAVPTDNGVKNEAGYDFTEIESSGSLAEHSFGTGGAYIDVEFNDLVMGTTPSVSHLAEFRIVPTSENKVAASFDVQASVASAIRAVNAYLTPYVGGVKISDATYPCTVTEEAISNTVDGITYTKRYKISLLDSTGNPIVFSSMYTGNVTFRIVAHIDFIGNPTGFPVVRNEYAVSFNLVRGNKAIDEYFSVTIPQIGFDLAAAVANGAKLCMRSGANQPREFAIVPSSVRYLPDTDTWYVRCKRSVDQSISTYFPNSNSVIATGDEYYLTGIVMPPLYVEIAAQKLLTAATAWLNLHSKPRMLSAVDVDNKIMAVDGIVLKEGMSLPISDTDLGIQPSNQESRVIDNIRIEEGTDAIRTFSVTLRDKKEKSALDAAIRGATSNFATASSVNEAVNKVVNTGHDSLTGRDMPNQHPISAITGLEDALLSSGFFEIGSLSSLVQLKAAYSYLGTRLGLLFDVTPETDVASSPAHLMLRNLGTAANPNYALYTPLPLITGGDQIIISGTPGQGGGGGGAGYIYELKDTLSTWIGRPAVSEMQVLVFDPSANVHDKNGNNGAWKYVNASSIGGVTSVVGQRGAVTAAQIATALTSAGYKLTDHEYSNGYGLNLSNGEFSLTQAVRDSLGLANTALQAASIKTLTLKVGTTTIGSAYNPIGSSNQTLTIAESNLTALLNDNYHPLYGEHDASAEKYFWIGGAKFVWHPAVGGTDGYLELQSAIVTTGDQIVNSGTPGGGGSGGGAGYLYELGDIYHDNAKTKVLRPDGQQRDNGDVLSFDSALGVWVALQKSSLLSGYALESYVDSEIWDSIQALNLGTASTYGVGTVASGNGGLVTGGSVYSAINDAVSSALKFQGITTTSISDGSTTNPIVINGSSYTAKKGDVVLYDGREFLWTGSAWEQLGDEESWALKTTTISAGTGLTGGGTLAANRTISMNQDSIDKLALAATAYQKPPGGIPNGDIATPWVKVGTTQISLGGQQTSLAGLVNVTMSGKLTIGSAEIEWVAGENGNPGYLKVNQALLTTGDQIVNSGTPGGGGGGGAMPYMRDIQDVSLSATVGNGDLLQWNGSAWVNVAANTVGGVTSVVNQTGKVTATQIADALTAAGYKLTDTAYTLPLAASGTRGGIQIGYSSSGKNYAVQLSSEKAYVNVPWTDTTYKLTLNGTAKGTTGGTDLGSFYAPTGGGTANQVLIAGGNNTAPSWTNQSNLSVGTASKLGSATVGSTLKPIYLDSGTPKAVTNIDAGLVYGYFDYSHISYLVSHPEPTGGVVVPFVYNDIAFLMAQGGHVTIYSTTDTDLTQDTLTVKTLWKTDTQCNPAFDASPSYLGMGNDTAAEMSADGIIIDIQLPRNFNYGNKFYIDFGTGTFGFNTIDILLKSEYDQETVYTAAVTGDTINESANYTKSISHRVAGTSRFDRMRIHLTGHAYTTIGVRIAQIGLINYRSAGHRYTMMSRGYDDAVWRSITPAANTYNLGGSAAASRWGTVYGVNANFSGTGTISGNTTIGGTLGVTGTLTVGTSSTHKDTTLYGNLIVADSFKHTFSGNDQSAAIAINGGNVDNYIWTVSDSYTTARPIQYGYGLRYIGSGNGVSNYLRLMAGNVTGTPIIALGINQNGQVGVGGDADVNYRLNIVGDTKTSGKLVVGDATIEWVANSGNGYLKIDKPLLTVGDQIVNSGTPGGGGGGGGAGFLYELGDVLTDSDHTVVKQYNGTDNAANNNLFAFNGSKWYALKLGTNLSITNGTLNATDTTYSNGTGLALSNGVFSITSAYQTVIANGASAYSTLTTSQTKNKVLASPSSASGAPSFRALVAADIPSLTVSKISDLDTNYVSIAAAQTVSAKHTFSTGLLLNTASSWSNTDRALYFSASDEMANLRYYSTDASKGLMFNPYSGALKAGSFVKLGGGSGFLKADGSEDTTAYLPLAGGTMTGSIKLTNGTYINAESGYAMLGIVSGGETFYCGPGAEITNAFYIRSGNINLTHVKAGTNYTIWDASNSNLSTVDWAANNLTVAGTSTFSDTMNVENRKYMYWKDSGGTSRNVFGLNNSNELLIGYGLSSVTGSATALYGETIRMSASSITELVKTGGGATLMFRGSALNNAPGTILFRGGTSESNGFKIEAEPYGTYGRVSLSFYTSNVSSGDAPYTPNWKRSMRIYYNGNIHLGVDGAFYPTVYSYGPIVIGTTTNNANLTVCGTITSTGDQVISSDATKKKNWRDLKYDVADIAKATAGVFDWKDGKGESAGTKAQDWMHLVPQLVHGEEGHMTLAYGQIAMLNTILLARRSEDHETRIKALELENAELRKEIERLRS